MCNRHSFSVTRAGKVLHGYGVTDSHTTIHELSGLSSEHDKANQYEWQPPDGWPDVDWSAGLTVDREAFPPKKKHLIAMEAHVREWYPDVAAWETPDSFTALPEGLSVGGDLDLRGTPITALPEGLSVGGGLYLRGTQITALPEGLSVGGSLDLDCGRFYSVEGARAKMSPSDTEI